MGINRRHEVPGIWRVPSGRLNHRYLATIGTPRILKIGFGYRKYFAVSIC